MGRRWAKIAWVALLGVVVMASLVLFVFPTQAYFSQRNELDQIRADVAELEKDNERLDRDAEKLKTPEEIERLARERYNMVRPGEQPLTVVPGRP